MAQNLGRAIYELATDDTAYVKGINAAQEKAKEFVANVKNLFGQIVDESKKAGDAVGENLQKPFDEAKKSSDKLNESVKATGETAKNGVVSGFSAAKTAVGGFVEGLGKIGLAGEGIKTIKDSLSNLAGGLTKGNAEFETYSTQIQTLIQNSDDFKNATAGITDPLILQQKAVEQTQAKMADMAKFGASTPFDLPGVVTATKTLMGFGLQADNAKERFGLTADQIRTIAGNVASGSGASFTEMATDMGKFSTGATGDVIARFQEMGILTKGQMRDMGIGFTASGQMIYESQEDLDRITGLVFNKIGDKYSGLMDAQSSTLDGMKSNLEDWGDSVKRQVTQPLFDPLKKSLQSFLAYTSSDAGKQAVADLAAGVQKGVDTIVGAFQKLEPIAKQVFEVVSALSPLKTVFDVISGFFSGGTDGAIDAFKDHLKTIGGFLGIDLVGAFDKVSGFISTVFTPIWNTLSTTFQQNILPSVQGFITFLTSEVFPALGQFADWFGQNVLPVIAEVAQTIFETLIPILGQLFSIFVDKVLPVVFKVVEAIAGFLKPIIEEIARLFKDVFLPILQNVGKFISEVVLPVIARFADFIGQVVIPVVTSLADFLGKILANALDVLSRLFQGAWELMSFSINVAWNIISGIFTALGTVIGAAIGLVGTLKDDFVNGWNMMVAGIGVAWDKISGVFNTIVNFVKTTFTDLWNDFSRGVGIVWDDITGFVTGAWDKISGVFNTIVDFLKNTLGAAWDGLGTGISIVWDGISSSIKLAWDWIDDNVFKPIQASLDTVGGWFNKLGDIIKNIWDGITDNLNKGVGVIKGIFEGVVNFLIDIINTPINLFNSVLDGLKGVPLLGGAIGWIGDIPTVEHIALAAGGITNGPMQALIGEAGQEAVLPLDQIKPLFAQAMNEIVMPKLGMSTVSNSTTFNKANQVSSVNYYLVNQNDVPEVMQTFQEMLIGVK